MVPVEIDGIRMLYPSCYVCVTMEDDAASCSKDEPVAPSMTPDELISESDFLLNVDQFWPCFAANSQSKLSRG